MVEWAKEKWDELSDITKIVFCIYTIYSLSAIKELDVFKWFVIWALGNLLFLSFVQACTKTIEFDSFISRTFIIALYVFTAIKSVIYLWWIIIPISVLGAIALLVPKSPIFFIKIGKNKKNPTIEFNTIDTNYMDFMEGHDFEHFCANILKNNGFYDVEVTKGSGDHGVDIIAYKNGIKYAIQCKRYSGSVGNKAIQEIYSGKDINKANIAVVMTNSKFTQQAMEDAHKLGVELWDREKLISMANAKSVNQENDYGISTKEDALNEINDCFERVKELAEIVNTTTDRAEFESSMSEIKIRLKALSECEGLGIFQNSTPSKDLKKIIANENFTRKDFLERIKNNNKEFGQKVYEKPIEKNSKENKARSMSTSDLERYAIACNAYVVKEERKMQKEDFI